MKILLVRHGSAGSANPKAWPDDDLRPLTAKGRKQFGKAARGLRALGLKPMRILTSPAERTRQTAELLAEALKLKTASMLEAPELHHGVPPEKALARLARMRLPASIALVGHQPWLGEFLSLLIAGDERAQIGLDKGGACLVEAEALGKGKGGLVWLLTQEQLASLA
ncbi:MAG: histidine phosphatase family protein [Fibrobacterota bacterium]|nr:histidine phosphatase family protein [Fibrobacterota bacterium]